MTSEVVRSTFACGNQTILLALQSCRREMVTLFARSDISVSEMLNVYKGGERKGLYILHSFHFAAFSRPGVVYPSTQLESTSLRLSIRLISLLSPALRSITMFTRFAALFVYALVFIGATLVGAGRRLFSMPTGTTHADDNLKLPCINTLLAKLETSSATSTA